MRTNYGSIWVKSLFHDNNNQSIIREKDRGLLIPKYDVHNDVG